MLLNVKIPLDLGKGYKLFTNILKHLNVFTQLILCDLCRAFFNCHVSLEPLFPPCYLQQNQLM